MKRFFQLILPMIPVIFRIFFLKTHSEFEQFIRAILFFLVNISLGLSYLLGLL
jgi:hypothetical protein